MPLRSSGALDELDEELVANVLAALLEPERETPSTESDSDGVGDRTAWLGTPPGIWIVATVVGGLAGTISYFTGGWAGLLVGLLIVGGILYFLHSFLREEPDEELPGEVDEPERRITALGRLDFVFEEASTEEGTLLFGPSELVGEIQLEVAHLPRTGEARELIGEIDRLLSEAPRVLEGESESGLDEALDDPVVLHGEERELRRSLEALTDVAVDRKVDRHELDLVRPEAPVRDLLTESDHDEAAGPAPELSSLLERWTGDEEPIDQDLEAALERWSRRHDIFHALRISSLSGTIAPLCHNLGDAFHYSGFNLYCADCNEERIENLLGRDYSVQSDQDHPPVRYPDETRCSYEPAEGRWTCRSCTRTVDHPIPVHKSLDEVFLPVYNRLMDENKNERLSVYSNIRDQELEYLNQCRSEIEEVARSGREAIEELETRVVQAQARIKGEEQALASFVEILEAYQESQRQAVRQIRRNTEEVREKVQEENERVREKLAEISRRSRERLRADNTRLARAQKIEDENRDALQRQILQSVRTSAAANVATASSTSEIAENTERMTGQLREMKGNQERQMHIQAAMAEESGVEIGASRFDFLGKLRERGAGAVSAISGEDDVDRAARKEEALS